MCLNHIADDGRLDTESDSGEFWALFGGFAPIGKKAICEDDVIPEAIPAQLYKYVDFFSSLSPFPHRSVSGGQ